ncbi:MAG: SAM-dependent methyltransferase, partial [Pseudomonadales bacterium]
MSLQTVRFDAIRLNQGDCLLDLGCGEGRHAISAYMAERLDAVGVDLSLADIKTTRDRFAEFADAGADIGADADANTVPDNDNKSLALAVADGQH